MENKKASMAFIAGFVLGYKGWDLIRHLFYMGAIIISFLVGLSIHTKL